MPVKVENGDFCPVCKEKNMPPWKSPTETARACQGCNTVEERKIRERGYYWLIYDGMTAIGAWTGLQWIAISLSGYVGYDLPEKSIEVKGKVTPRPTWRRSSWPAPRYKGSGKNEV